MRYPHYVRISTPSNEEPVQDPRGGIYEPAPATLVYSGPADVQDVGESIVYSVDQSREESDATIFLEDESAIPNINSGMTVHIWWSNPPPTGVEGTEPLPVDVVPDADAKVGRVTRLDGTLHVDFV